MAPVAVSATVIVYSTFDSAPKNTQKLPLVEFPSSTLSVTSTFSGAKNQK